MTGKPLTATDFRHALGHFATGVTVITAERGNGEVYGMTASSFASVSLEPFLILVCVDERSGLLPLLHKKRRFGVSVLKEGQQSISVYFAQPEQNGETESRLGIRYRWTEKGIPLIENALAHLACNIVASHPAGDHTIFLGEVESAEVFAGEPLLHFQGAYRRMAP
jgi:flavin reductase (DIM6/NTAB) family NADH-FMN oxidoreductase RutF